VPPSKPGRRLGPISDRVGTTHRAWLEPLRNGYLASGMTMSELSDRAGFAPSKISELMRGTGLYPRWEITYSLLHVLGLPAEPMRWLWKEAAATEADKKPEWIEGCIRDVAVCSGPAKPPLDHYAFAALHTETYKTYARTFLPEPRASRVVHEVLVILWLLWKDALESSKVEKYAWPILRRCVMARARRLDGHPTLAAAAFGTVALLTASQDRKIDQFQESMALFHAIGQLPDLQLDVTVLIHLHGLPEEDVAGVLGLSKALIQSTDRYAQHRLDTVLNGKTS
jgi:DNA-directed RNA polymerase specialized sigma24 family protein